MPTTVFTLLVAIFLSHAALIPRTISRLTTAMCHKTYHKHACGCTKLKALTFCRWVDDAEHLVAGHGMHHYGAARQFDLVVDLKSHHDAHAADDDTVSFDGDDDYRRVARLVEAEFERLRAKCQRDSVLLIEVQDGVCVLCRRWALPEGVVYVGKGARVKGRA